MPKPTKPTTKTYIANADGWTAGQWRAKGSSLELTEKQAQYENVSPAPEPAKAAPAKGSTAKK